VSESNLSLVREVTKFVEQKKTEEKRRDKHTKRIRVYL